MNKQIPFDNLARLQYKTRQSIFVRGAAYDKEACFFSSLVCNLQKDHSADYHFELISIMIKNCFNKMFYSKL